MSEPRPRQNQVMRRICLILALGASVTAAGCAGTSPAGGSLYSAGALPPMHMHRTLPSQLLFIPTENGSIEIYPLKNPNESGPIAQITGLTALQGGMVVDESGNLFVANNGAFGNDDYISEYAAPYDGAPTILNTSWMSQVFYPVGVAVDASGTLYVSGCGGYCNETPAIYVYPPGATLPSTQIASSQFSSLGGITSDANGNLFVVSWNDATFAVDVFKVKAGTTKPKALHLHGLLTGGGGNGVALDAAGDLYVAATGGSDYILEYRPHAHNAFRVIDNFPFGDDPLQLQVGPDRNLYVPVNCPSAPCARVLGFRRKGHRPFESVGSSSSSLTTTLSVGTAPNLLLEGSSP